MTFEELDKQLGGACSRSLLGPVKSRQLFEQLMATENVPGCISEIGVYKGDTAKLIHLAMPNKHLHLYDTFAGIVKANAGVDVHKNGDFGDASLDAVKKLVGEDKVTYHVGMFPDTFTEDKEVFSFVHSDTDTYFGTMQTLIKVLPLVAKGGRIVFDDYEWQNCPGVKKAIVEFIMDNNLPLDAEIHQNQYVIKKL